MTAPPAFPPPGPAATAAGHLSVPVPAGQHQHLRQSVQQGMAVYGLNGNLTIVVQSPCPCDPSRSCERRTSHAAHSLAASLQELLRELRAQWRRLVGPIGPDAAPLDPPGDTGP
ncbi:hypothetical protein [Kitasatospora cineracea]|uniref:hypothetical protein n=1 Tax=Kitasatospora cineracea TaxID=88074 RepID=UPI00381310A1